MTRREWSQNDPLETRTGRQLCRYERAVGGHEGGPRQSKGPLRPQAGPVASVGTERPADWTRLLNARPLYRMPGGPCGQLPGRFVRITEFQYNYGQYI